MSYVVKHLKREVIELPKLSRSDLAKPAAPPCCRQCGGSVQAERGENNEFETIKWGDIFTQFTQGQDSNNSSTSNTSQQSELCSQCLTVNSVSSLGDEDERERERRDTDTHQNLQVQSQYSNGTVKQSHSPTPTPSILSAATSVITLQNSGGSDSSQTNHNNNELMMHMYHEDVKPLPLGSAGDIEIKQENVVQVAQGLAEVVESSTRIEFIVPQFVAPEPADVYDNGGMITDSLDDHSELIIINKPEGTGYEFQPPSLPYSSTNQDQYAELKPDIPLTLPPTPNMSITSSSIITTNPNNSASISVVTQSRPTPTPKIYSCTLCSKVFKNGRIAKAHQDRVHDKLARYFCDTCGGAFSYRWVMFFTHYSHALVILIISHLMVEGWCWCWSWG